MQNNQNVVPGLISIIIPVYRVRLYIERCISSVLEQSYQNIEIIVVDDIGGDDSVELAEKMLCHSQISYYILHHDKNKGLSAARNTGVKQARGEYLFFLDSDDYLAVDALEKLYNEARESQADIVFGNYYNVYGENVCAGFWTRTGNMLYFKPPLEAHIDLVAFPMAPNRLIRHDFYLKSGVVFKEGILHEDEPWAFELALVAQKYSFIQDVTYYYRKERPGSITYRYIFNQHRLESLFYAIQLYSKASEKYNLMEKTLFRNWYAGRILNFCSQVNSGCVSGFVKRDFYRRVLTTIVLPRKELTDTKAFRWAKFFSPFLYDCAWVRLVPLFNTMFNRLRKTVRQRG